MPTHSLPLPHKQAQAQSPPPPPPPPLASEVTAMPSAGEPCSSLPASAVAVELLDQYWYSFNVLSSSSKAVGVPARATSPLGGSGEAPSCSSPTEDAAAVARDSGGEAPPVAKSPARRRLLRTPSLPPRVGREKATRVGACSHKPGGGAKLRHSYSNLESVILFSPAGGTRQHLSPKLISQTTSVPRAHTMAPHGSGARQRPPLDARVESIIRYVDGHHRAITGAFQVKKWRSLSDLETEEVQGFKDLGFVFNAEAGSSGVVEVVPGLRRGEAASEAKKVVRRPYLSEAWVVQRSAPPALDWVGGRSAADVKDQLRFWARVVASNVRQER